MKYLIFLISFSCYSQDQIQKYIIDEVNKWRVSPVKEMLKYHPSKRDYSILKLKTNKTPLVYDERLSKNAFIWAREIAQGEFKHSMKSYYNESIYKGYLPKCVVDLIIDSPDELNLSKDFGHRKHLLGAAFWSKDDTKIGVGYYRVRGSIYAIVIRTY